MLAFQSLDIGHGQSWKRPSVNVACRMISNGDGRVACKRQHGAHRPGGRVSSFDGPQDDTLTEPEAPCRNHEAPLQRRGDRGGGKMGMAWRGVRSCQNPGAA